MTYVKSRFWVFWHWADAPLAPNVDIIESQRKLTAEGAVRRVRTALAEEYDMDLARDFVLDAVEDRS